MSRRRAWAGLCAIAFALGCPPGATLECQLPQSLLFANGEPSGFIQCADGAVNRLAALPVPTPAAPLACQGDEPDQFCLSDEDCTAAANGRCGHFDPAEVEWLPRARCECIYACATDDDCGAGQACIPTELSRESGNASCQPALCRENADCESGECALRVAAEPFSATDDSGPPASAGLNCRNPEADDCRADGDCDSGQRCGGRPGEREATRCEYP